MPRGSSRFPPTSPASAWGAARRAAPALPRGTFVRSSVHAVRSVRAASRVACAREVAAAADVRALLQV